MICLNVTEHADPSYGGIASSVPALARAMAASGRYRCQNVAFCEPWEHAEPGTCRLPVGRLDWMSDRSARLAFDGLVAAADVVHVHGLWRQHSFSACRTAERHGKPYVVSAHGMLEPWALRNKRWKKLLYGALVEKRNLRHASCLRALTRREALDYQAYGMRGPIAIVPNGVDAPPSKSPDPFLSAYPALRGRRLVLFLGRVHYKKGLDVLCRAWAATPRAPHDHLVIAGPDFEGTQANLEIGSDVTFTGLLGPELRWSALAAAHVFVLPSYSEGLSMAVLEALAAGVPVIASPACNLPEIRERGCGWVVEPAVQPVARALAEALEITPAERAHLGSNGSALAAESFSWPRVAARVARVYDWMLGGPAPSEVEVIQ